MSAEELTVPRTPRPRPRGARGRIAREATELFGTRGYPDVRMVDIAERLGVTARALYRHYPNKEALLLAVCRDALSNYLDVAREPGESSSEPTEQFRQAVRGLVTLNLDKRHSTMLWHRDMRYLSEPGRSELVELVRAILSSLAGYIAKMDGMPPTRIHRFQARTILSIVTSCGLHQLSVHRPQSDELLIQAAQMVVTRREGSSPLASAEGATEVTATLDSRFDELLRAATTLFARSGYAAVRLEDIGAEAGIVGPSIYHYVDNKSDILVRLIERWYDFQTLAYTRAISGNADPVAAVEEIFREFRILTSQFPGLFTVALNERLYLPDGAAQRIYRTESALFRTITSALRRARPELDQKTAITVMYAAIAAISNIARSRVLARRSDVAQYLDELVYRMCFELPVRKGRSVLPITSGC